jgi:quercetin dioxygenase-like cupin family protein
VIRTGQTIENPVTGEQVTFRTTAADTGGELVVIDVVVAPDGAVAAAHVHPSQEERFTVNAGELEMTLRKQTIVAKAGDVVLVPAGTPHRSGTSATLPRASPARFGPRSASSPCSRRCSRSRATARRIARHAEPAASRRDRACALRHGSAPVPTGVDAMDRARAGRPARPLARLRADVRATGPSQRRRGRTGMRRRRRLRRRLLWAGALLGLVLLLAVVSVMRVAVWTRAAIEATTFRRRNPGSLAT